LVSGRPVVFRVDGREIGVVRLGSQVYAVRNVCPHQSAALCSGTVERRALRNAPIGAPAAGQSVPVISCPWHGWEFDLRTGRALVDPTRRVAVYPAAIRDGFVVVETRAQRSSGDSG
jgi:nitrite reductase (NADH) small subunit